MCEETKNYRTATISVRFEADNEADALNALFGLVNTVESVGKDVTDTTLNKNSSIAAQANGHLYISSNGGY